MSESLRKKVSAESEISKIFSEKTADVVFRIEEQLQVIGIMYMEDKHLRINTTPENISQSLSAKLPKFTDLVRRAISEIDVLDELLVFRVETTAIEILVAPAGHNTACVVQRVKKRKHKKK